MEIKLISDKYSPQAVNLILPIQQGEFGVPVSLEDQPDLTKIDEFYIRPGGGFWGAFINDELVGTLALINTGHAAGGIRKMFVKKEYRGKELSIAQKLFETLLAFAKTKGIKDLYLGSVDQMKAAHRFYERNGFRKIAKDQLPPYYPRMNADTVFYHLSLNK